MIYRTKQIKSWLLPGLILPVLLLNLNGCAQESTAQSPDSNQVATIPALPSAARQGTAPDFCLPSCSEGLIQRRESMLQKLTEEASQD